MTRACHRNSGRRLRVGVLPTLGASMLLPAPFGDANEPTVQLSLGGLLAGSGQCQVFGEEADKSQACRGALPLRPRLLYRVTGRDELHLELGYAAGNGLNEVSPFPT